jgi:transposase-like protein
MSDKDVAQINALESVWSEAKVDLCWWHVIHAWNRHISISHFKDVWALLKQWVRNDTQEKFDSTWLKLQEIAPTSFIEYLKKEWMPGAF